MAAFRWRGKLNHLSAYVLVPFRGVRETEFLRSLPPNARLAPRLLREDENSHAKRERLGHSKRAT